MSIERQYIRQFLNESKKQDRKFEDSEYKYAYNTEYRAEEHGYEVQDSIEELEANWNEDEEFNPNDVLVMKPATSIDRAMVWTSGAEGDFIYPSIDAAINGSMGLYALGWKEGATISKITEEEIQELLRTEDLKKAEELLEKAFVDAQDFGYFESLYEYVSGPMPEENGVTPGKTLVKNKKKKASARDFEYYRRKVLTNPYNLEKVPDKLKTLELCKLAVEKDGYALEYVPDELKTPELCKIAVEKNGYTLEYVPDELKTPELCKFAVEKNGYMLRRVPDKLKTLELCKRAVEKNGYALEYVPDKLKTLELCKIAVEDESSVLEYVPDQLKEQVKKELGMK